MKTRNLILVRHGQSEWNEQNLFTGWKDPGLTELGIKEAKNAGSLISDKGIQFDEMFTSIIDKLKKNENIFGEYNLIVTAGPKNDSSYSMIFNKAIIKKSLLNLYFDITQQEKSSIAMTAITYPVCLLHIENINKYELKILIQ